jgi:hypothetical protein
MFPRTELESSLNGAGMESSASPLTPVERLTILWFRGRAGVAELAYAGDLKSPDLKVMRVRVPPSAPSSFLLIIDIAHDNQVVLILFQDSVVLSEAMGLIIIDDPNRWAARSSRLSSTSGGSLLTHSWVSKCFLGWIAAWSSRDSR